MVQLKAKKELKNVYENLIKEIHRIIKETKEFERLVHSSEETIHLHEVITEGVEKYVKWLEKEEE